MAQLAARKYAVALFELYLENEGDQLAEEASAVLNALTNEGALRETLLHPRVTAEEKIDILNNVFKGAGNTMLGFLNVVVRKNRESELALMLKIFVDLVEEHKGILNAEVFTASPLSETQIENIRQNLAKNSNKTVNIEVKEDKSLIGGLCVKAGGFIYDMSVKKQLEDMRLSLLG